MVEVFKKCNEIAKWEEETGETSPGIQSSTSILGSTSTVTASSATSKPSTTTKTADLVEVSTSQTDKKRPTHTSFDEIGFNKSSSVLRRRIEEGHLNQAFTLFAPLSMAGDLTKIQFTLCNEIKAELQAIQKAVAAIPFDAMKNDITETTKIMEERMRS